MESVNSILATDCGSTTTKAILILKDEKGEYRLINRGEAPTTVEVPFDDVTIGVLNAVRELEEITGRKLIENNKLITPQKDSNTGVDIYLSTSSAGGGLQMSVAGVVKSMTAESAQHAALGAGAIVSDVLAIDDRRKPHERILRIRQLRPDMVLLAGGTDGGTITHIVELAETILSADPLPRFGTGMKMPVIYAGNKVARDEVNKILGKNMAITIVDNLRPVLERENLAPAREAIHRLFLEHVMSQAPGYNKLMGWTEIGIMPTPAAVGEIIQTIAREERINVLAVDIGGATTDVFSVFKETFNRTVSANYGMSYSICNVLVEAGVENIIRWIPFEIGEDELRNILRNKMIRPTTIPHTLKDLLIEQAVAREALRLAFEHHKQLAVELKGVQHQRTVGDILTQTASGQTLVNMMELNMIVGSGGVLSHSPQRTQSAFMMLDAFQPQGITALTVDSIFMMPQLGILSTVYPKAASEVFHKDCLIYLGTSIVPVGEAKEGAKVLSFSIKLPKGDANGELTYGSLKCIPLSVGETAEAELKPEKNFDIGAGRGKSLRTKLTGGVSGIIIDCRGRPLILPKESKYRIAKLKEWLSALNLPNERPNL